MNELSIRAIVGLLLVAVAVAVAWTGGMAFAFFVAAVSTAIYWEWMQLVRDRGLGWKVAGFFYCLIPAIALLWLRDRSELLTGLNGFYLVLWVFIVTWATDIGGYAVGKTMGRNKLAPAISPNKTWEGLVGGMVFAAVFGGLWTWRVGLPHGLFMFAPFAAVAAQVGDLFESQMKRVAGVKDSGRWLPGHGGVFDRLDGLLVVATLTAVLIYTETL